MRRWIDARRDGRALSRARSVRHALPDAARRQPCRRRRASARSRSPAPRPPAARSTSISPASVCNGPSPAATPRPVVATNLKAADHRQQPLAGVRSRRRGVVTLTAHQQGRRRQRHRSANQLPGRIRGRVQRAGVTVAVGAMAGGTANPILTNASGEPVLASRSTSSALPYTDTASLNALRDTS